MPVMERAGSRNSTTIDYQCGECHYRVTVPLGKRGNRTYEDRILCPKCARRQVDNPQALSYTPR